jgi:hypothetical protein
MNQELPSLSASLLAALRLRGQTLLSTDVDYALARRVWNAAIDRHAGAIVVCADAEDVTLALQRAAEHRVAVTVRGGGHNVAGRSIADGTWKVAFTSAGVPPFNHESLDVWHRDGTEFESADIPPITGAVCVGVWKRTGPMAVQLDHYGFTSTDAGPTKEAPRGAGSLR